MTGEEIRTRRKALGLTLLDLSRAVGMSESHIAGLETGRAKITPAKVHGIEYALSEIEKAVAAVETNHKHKGK